MDVGGLQALGTLGHLELDLLVLLEVLVAGALDAGEVHEHVGSVRLRDEAVALLGAEPLHGSGCHERITLLAWPARASLRSRVRPPAGEPARVLLEANCLMHEPSGVEPISPAPARPGSSGRTG